MFTAEELLTRRNTLGASEIAAVVGLSPWATKHDVWMSKLGLMEQRETLATRVGELIEPVIRQLYVEDSGAETAYFGTIVHPQHTWASATPDFAVSGHRRLGEIKCVGWRLARHWSTEADGVPDYYRVQAEWQMEVCDADECDIAALIGGTEFKVYRLKRDRELGALLLEKGSAFWRDFVLTATPPPADGSESARQMLKRLYPRSKGELLQATERHQRLVVELMAERDLVAKGEARIRLLENQVREAIGENDGLVSDEWIVTNRSDKNGKRSLRLKERMQRKVA
jgi:putative phage-type endonuclease